MCFPDRVAPFRVGDREFALVVNAGEAGGAVVADVRKRVIAQRIPSPHGLATPVFMPAARAIVAAGAGKLKYRGSEDVEKSYRPHAGVFVFEVPSGGGPLFLRAISTEGPTHALRALAPETSPLVLASGGADADQWCIIDVAASRVVERAAAPGRVIRLAPQIP